MKTKKRKAKKGFTLIEAGAVICIMMMLMTFFVPKVSEYIVDAKKANIMAQAKTVVFAWETINSKEGEVLGVDKTKEELDKFGSKYVKYFDLAEAKNIPKETTINTCMQVVKGADFEIGTDGNLLKVTVSEG